MGTLPITNFAIGAKQEGRKVRMNDGSPLSGEWLTAWERAMLIEEAKEQNQFAEFYASIPDLVILHKTQESHLPLTFLTNTRREGR